MEHNFFRRIEVCFPIQDAEHRDRITRDLECYLKDNSQALAAWYRRLTCDSEGTVSAQSELLRRWAEYD